MKPLAGKKVLMIIAHKDFRDEEYREPRKVLEDAGAQVIVASSSMNVCKGMLGMQVKPDVLYTDVKGDDCDAVVFVGGTAPRSTGRTRRPTARPRGRQGGEDRLGDLYRARDPLRTRGSSRKEATVWPSESGQIEGKGARYRKAGVVRDGRIVTADGPESAAVREEAGRGVVLVRELGFRLQESDLGVQCPRSSDTEGNKGAEAQRHRGPSSDSELRTLNSELRTQGPAHDTRRLFQPIFHRRRRSLGRS